MHITKNFKEFPLISHKISNLAVISQAFKSCQTFVGETSLVSPFNKRFAMITLAASLGWKVSQKMYLDRSSQTFE